MTGRRDHLVIVGDEPLPTSPNLDQPPELWDPPETYRQGLEQMTELTMRLYDQVDHELLVPADLVQFLALRIRRLAFDLHRALPEGFE